MTKQTHVLVVEDDGWLGEQHERVLQSAGYGVTLAANAIVAIDSIDARRPDVIIMDVLLSGPNAFTLLHELRSHTDLADIPVILCTNSADSIAVEDISAYGVCQVIDKTTMQPYDVVAAVKKALL